MQHAELYHIVFLILAALLEIIANIFLKYSDGLKRWPLVILSLVCALAAFRCLAETVKKMDLSVAYALWGGVGVVATALAGIVLFNQQLNWRGWTGILILIMGMTVIQFS